MCCIKRKEEQEEEKGRSRIASKSQGAFFFPRGKRRANQAISIVGEREWRAGGCTKDRPFSSSRVNQGVCVSTITQQQQQQQQQCSKKM